MPLIMPVYGTRPEAIKMAPLVHALRGAPGLDVFITLTGQHREMLDQVNSLFNIAADHDLNIISDKQTLVDITGRTLVGLNELFARVRPDAVIVQGDTNSAAAAALAGFYHHIPVVHLEAGLRSGNPASPFPEEGNRKVISQLAALHLAPTAESRANLLRENVRAADIAVTGNTVIDALLSAARDESGFTDPGLAGAGPAGAHTGPRLLVTTHRRENFGESMQNIGKAVASLAIDRPELQIVFPAHRSPVMREAVLPHLENLSNVLVTEPLAYGDFTKMLAASDVILTDSGGVQEEAPSLGKPVLVMRANTERPEAVAAGTVKLVGTDVDRIVAEVGRLLDDPSAHAAMARATNPYGDGRAAARSVAAIAEFFGLDRRLPDFEPAG